MKKKSKNMHSPKESKVAELISNKGFSGLSEENKKLAITTVKESKSSDGGVIGRIVGTNPTNAAINAALIICCVLVIVGFATNGSQWDKIIPAIAATIGYIFGKSTN